MKKLFENMNLYTKTFVIAFLSGVLVSIVLLILGICGLLSLFIPLGIFLGSLFSASSYFVLGKIDSLDIDANKKTKYTMIVMYVRLFFLLAFEATEVLLQYFNIVTLFNPFGFLGAYLFTSFVYLIVYFGEKHATNSGTK